MTDPIPPEASRAAVLAIGNAASMTQTELGQGMRIAGDAHKLAQAALAAASPVLRKADQDTISSLMGSVRAAEQIIENRDRYIAQLENRLAALEGVSPC
jgi:2-polyprenyl-6-methoxyphenol hydroxylase-like FAD-dependent oxidoreductase